VAGDVTRLQFPDQSFDCVFCTEVLEHIPALEKAAREITRVARHEIIIGVPYRQDTRVGRATCGACWKVTPAWGHVNAFDDDRLLGLFPGLRLLSKTLVASNSEATNPVSTFLMDVAGNPWGTYDEDIHCVHCGQKLLHPPRKRSLATKICSAAAERINRAQAPWTKPHANWIHVVLSKD
jgi:SAM-dependent methyltransferase